MTNRLMGKSNLLDFIAEIERKSKKTEKLGAVVGFDLAALRAACGHADRMAAVRALSLGGVYNLIQLFLGK